MNYLEFITSLIHVLVWPTAIVIIVLILREPLRRIVGNMTSLKYRNMEISFERELSALGAKAKEINLKSKKIAPPRIDREKSSTELLDEATRLVSEFPEPAIAIAWSAVEQELEDTSMRLGLRKEKHTKVPSWRTIEKLRHENYIHDHILDILNKLQNLRNLAVHGHYGVTPVKVVEARQFLAHASNVIDTLKHLNPKERG